MGTNAYGESLTAWVMGFHPSLAIFFCISILVFRIFWVRGGPDLVYIMHISFHNTKVLSTLFETIPS